MSSDRLAFVPPNDIDAEKSLLGLILLNGKILDDVADKLKSQFFYDHRHAMVYDAMLRLWATQKPVDIIFVLDEVRNADKKDEETAIDKDFLL